MTINPMRNLDPVQLELFTNRFRAIAHEMGEMLQRSAISTNVRERMDFSCALLDANGELVVNAPHIPVHLGALGLCVRQIAAALPLEPGDVVISNHPGYGGSHLPDVTLVTPVFDAAGQLAAYVANRCHHAEIGGLTPGSMPPGATRLVEEGVILPPLKLIAAGHANWQHIEERLQTAPYPSRAVQENLADLRAGVAANQRGVHLLQALLQEYGTDLIWQYMDGLRSTASAALGESLARLPDEEFQAVEYLDDGSMLAVSLLWRKSRLRISFAGSAEVHPGNLNATPAIVRSAVLYVMRLLAQQDLPMNEGLLANVELDIPRGMLNPDFSQAEAELPAVVGGNVETSQRLVGLLIKALRLCASSQGTMNNLLFGNEDFGYYETICGGCGAGQGFHGAAAVHSHMTNTRITDPEILEHRYPVRLQRFAIRRGSGGQGAFSGGDGIVRELTFLKPVSVSFLGQHRSQGPFGMAGGKAGKPGEQCLKRADGTSEHLTGASGFSAQPGDILIIKTPGGGGYGSAPESSSK